MSDDPRLVAIGRAVPERTFSQAELYRHNPWPRSTLLDRLFLESPIATRHLFVPPDFWNTARTVGETNAAWRDGALSLGGAALEDALDRAALAPTRVDFLGVTTVTGYATPGLDLLLAHAHGLRPTLQRAHFNNIGCHAAVPLLRTAADHAARHPGATAVALAVEVCSACFSPTADDPQSQVAAALFADGAAAAVVSTTGTGPRLVDFASSFDFAHLDALGFDLTTDGFRIVLDPRVPDHVGAGIASLVADLLQRQRLSPSDIATWCFHPGGSRVLDAVQRGLRLDDASMRHSRRVLRRYGNMSSPSVLFVLAEALASAPPPPDSWIVLAAFGPGLGIEAALLRTDAR